MKLIFIFNLLVITFVHLLKIQNSLKATQCEPLCLECSFDDSKFCQVCKQGVYQYNNKCFNKCPEGTYSDTEWQICRPCDISCPVCWGPSENMCGTTVGVKTRTVLLENEIKNYFENQPFNNQNIRTWLSNLNIILKNVDNSNVDKFDELNILSPEDVYSTKKVYMDLPIGSFSSKNGVFIPIPSYLNKNVDLIKSHWVYINGMWNGRNWNYSWFPLVPSFIKYKGEKDKIYYENGGYWIYQSSNNEWFWKKTNMLKENKISIEEILFDLNTIKFDTGDFNTKFLYKRVLSKKIQMKNNIKTFFNEFSESNKLLFAKLKDTVSNEENQVKNALDLLKSKLKIYFNEESILSKHKNTMLIK